MVVQIIYTGYGTFCARSQAWIRMGDERERLWRGRSVESSRWGIW